MSELRNQTDTTVCDLQRRLNSWPTQVVAPPVNQSRMFVCGRVEPGDKRGRTLGFPTANVGISIDSISPPDGVYAGYLHRSTNAVHQAAVSIGRRPTFYADRGLHLLEAHILDFDENLYGEVITIELVSRLREQVRFDGIDDLRAQLATDVERTREALSLHSPTSVLASDLPTA